MLCLHFPVSIFTLLRLFSFLKLNGSVSIAGCHREVAGLCWTLPDKACTSQNSADRIRPGEVELLLERWGTNSALLKPGQCEKLLAR